MPPVCALQCVGGVSLATPFYGVAMLEYAIILAARGFTTLFTPKFKTIKEVEGYL